MYEYAPCPHCEYENPLENRFCGRCGASLTAGGQLAPRREDGPAFAPPALPTKLEPVGKVLTLGLATLAAGAGLSWLSYQVGRADRPPLPAARGARPATPEQLTGQSLEEVFVWLQEGDFQGRGFAWRVVQTFGAAEPLDRHWKR